MLLRLGVLGVVGVSVWLVIWALRRYSAHAQPAQRFDPTDVGGSGAAPLLISFSGPYCLACQEMLPRLEAASSRHQVPLAVIDVKANPELAAKYDVRLTPTTLVVGPGGRVAEGWVGTPPDGAIEEALGLLVSTTH